MPEPIQQRRGSLLIAKHLHPFATGEMTRDDRGALAVTFGEDVEKQLAPGAFERHKAEFIHDEEIDLHQAWLDTPSRPLISGFYQGAHERRRAGKQDPVTAPRGFDTQAHAERRLPRPDRSDHHHLLTFHELITTSQFPHLRA
jgi:hypothetical protein